MDANLDFYNSHAEQLASDYDSLAFESVHSLWKDQVPDSGFALDIGAGSGRDARYLADHGMHVVAVEPAQDLLRLAKSKSQGRDIHWLSDSLPELDQVFALNTKFDLILLSAVWMHIPPSHRQRCFRKLASLVKPGGKLVISLRHGECDDGRAMYDVSADELAELSKNEGFAFSLLGDGPQKDQLKRNTVHWETVVLTLPDDGTGAFSLIRNIVINDKKASTYKLALLRSILRIAEGHPGAIIDQDDDSVSLPMGLVAFYWYKLYQPLVDTYGLQQNSNPNLGLGFIKEDGWQQLTLQSHLDLTIGAMYVSERESLAIHNCLKQISRTIKDMPAKYITMPNSGDRVFGVELKRGNKPNGALVLDSEYFSSLGSFRVPRSLWYNFSNYSIWIEPALVNEWLGLMASFKNNKERDYSKGDYLEALAWAPPNRTTDKARQRVDELLAQQSLSCCWSGCDLDKSTYAIDHAFPFARWPNNDLWNLLPATEQVNSKKSDRLPNHLQMIESKERIMDWWKTGWQNEQQEFFIQSNMALPGLNHKNRNIDDVFEAMLLQRDRIREIQQLQEWHC